MAVYFIDLDGTLLKHGTSEPTDGAQKLLDELEQQGHEVIITTRRGDYEWESHPDYSLGVTSKILKKLGWDKYRIIWDVPSPRIVINDEDCCGLKVKRNEGFSDRLIQTVISLSTLNES